jgi:hypothetical protein
MPEESQSATPWKRIMAWVGGATAILGLIATLSGGVGWFQNRRAQHAELAIRMDTAHAQAQEGDYEAVVQTYAAILKTYPLYRPALDQQLDATELWVENFEVVGREDQNTADLAAPKLDQIFSILDAALARTKGSQQADVQAHLGLAHWLNETIAKREFGPTAEQDLHAALQADPSNVYANATLGAWMLQKNQNFSDANAHLNAAAATGRARPFVRNMQLAGLMDHDTPGARAALIQAANDMRKSSEPLDEDTRGRILSFCCDPMLGHAELFESLSAVPPDEASQTYLWLDDRQQEGDTQRLRRDFIAASLLEISGKRPEALEKYRALQQQLKGRPGSLKQSVDAAIARLSHA